MANNNKNRFPLSLTKVKDMYHKSDVVMGEHLLNKKYSFISKNI